MVSANDSAMVVDQSEKDDYNEYYLQEGFPSRARGDDRMKDLLESWGRRLIVLHQRRQFPGFSGKLRT